MYTMCEADMSSMVKASCCNPAQYCHLHVQEVWQLRSSSLQPVSPRGCKDSLPDLIRYRQP